ncbi:hypothetical protein KJ969_05265 [Patescibacteria group bacterium]|nr:hypothetical protein [Patescibacteria group bacterium]
MAKTPPGATHHRHHRNSSKSKMVRGTRWLVVFPRKALFSIVIMVKPSLRVSVILNRAPAHNDVKARTRFNQPSQFVLKLLFLTNQLLNAIFFNMMELNTCQHKLYAEKVMDLANLSLVALTFASFFGSSFKAVLAISGIILFIIFVFLNYILSKGA